MIIQKFECTICHKITIVSKKDHLCFVCFYSKHPNDYILIAAFSYIGITIYLYLYVI